MSEVEELFKRLGAHKNVIGILVTSHEGIAIRSTMNTQQTVLYAGIVHGLSTKCKNIIREIDPSNDLTFLRIRTKKSEIMMAPDKEYILTVVQSQC